MCQEMIGEVVNNTQLGKRYPFIFLLIALISIRLGNRLILHKASDARNVWNTVTGHTNVKAKGNICIVLQEQKFYRKELKY